MAKKNQKTALNSIFVYGDEYFYTYFFDTNSGDGIDIKDENGYHVCEVFGWALPDENDDTSYTKEFNETMIEAVKAAKIKR